ncbi:MAG: GGDEF domain-containing protein [Treponema sp.]|uniref:GGDEF domain-containing protein n=1 Tax=Treponema sp. TaxID=166 RepID=UPI002A91B04C|nr:GGDEF domain-containing protein [Treponema sp.]MDY6396151.1 GGDEF domain-containing protein [Treponema sp.]
MEMTVDLFDSIINTSQDCVFWKDKNRRFLGVNQAFLDYYGFKSADVLIGKNDEEMGWHSDPDPYKQDELRVLSGKTTYKVQGKCFIRGEERDIIASKRPLYNGDEIVGLVGSFVDITDVVRRKEKNDGSQVLYTIDKLRKYSFFDKIIDEISLEEILDPLTGILNRSYSMKFVRSLIAEKIPFTFTIIDLDNFKFINDTYGHTAGDKVLAMVSKSLAEFTDGFALAGRFGGDELLLIDLKNITIKEKTDFFENLYGKSKTLRKEVFFENGAAFVTGTSGCASFPEDSDNFSHLFGLIDKMLYLGKNMGRNCYKVYEEEKHKYVEIRKIAKSGIFKSMYKLRTGIESETGFENKLKKVMPLLAETLQIKDFYYVTSNGDIHAVLDKNFNGDASDLQNIMEDDLFSQGSLDLIKKHSPKFYKVLSQNGFESVLISRIRKKDKIKGYLVCAVDRSLRIWQENECAIVYYLAELLSDDL